MALWEQLLPTLSWSRLELPACCPGDRKEPRCRGARLGVVPTPWAASVAAGGGGTKEGVKFDSSADLSGKEEVGSLWCGGSGGPLPGSQSSPLSACSLMRIAGHRIDAAGLVVLLWVEVGNRR